ncbi:MAG: hypothetical protein R3B89_24325 [Polyangiaceae bacterium]
MWCIPTEAGRSSYPKGRACTWPSMVTVVFMKNGIHISGKKLVWS